MNTSKATTRLVIRVFKEEDDRLQFFNIVSEVHSFIAGPELPEDQPWTVQLPRTLVKCQHPQRDLQDLDKEHLSEQS